MQISKSNKILNQARSSIYTFTELTPFSINSEEKKNAQRKKSKKCEKPEKSPKDQDKYKTPAKSISGLKSLKFPQKKTEKIEKSITKDTRFQELSPVLDLLPKEIKKKPMMKSSISPKIFRNLSPLSETLTEGEPFKKSSNLNNKKRLLLRHLDLAKELEMTQQTLNHPQNFKPRSCLEDIILLGESKTLSDFSFIEENLKVCTSILRNLIGRLENIGKSNEAVLLDKFWRHVVETIDQTIEAFMTNKKSETFNGKRQEFDSLIQRKIPDFESSIKDPDLESFKSFEKSEIFESLEISQMVSRVQLEIEKISRVFEKKTKSSEEAENFLRKDEVNYPLSLNHSEVS